MFSTAYSTLNPDLQPAHRIVLASSTTAKSPGIDQYLGWDSVSALFQTFKECASRLVKQKHSNRLVFSAHFLEGMRRTRNNVTKMAQVLFFDVDHTQADFGDVADALDGLAWLVHTTFSHTEEDRCFRAMVVLSRCPTPLEWFTARRVIIAALAERGIKVDAVTKDAARGYFLPCNGADVLFDDSAPLTDPTMFGEPTEEDRKQALLAAIGPDRDLQAKARLVAAERRADPEARERELSQQRDYRAARREDPVAVRTDRLRAQHRRRKPASFQDAYRIVLILREELALGATRGGALSEISADKQKRAAEGIMDLIKGRAWPEGLTNDTEFLVAQTLAMRAPQLDFSKWLVEDARVQQSFAATNAHASTEYSAVRLIARIESNLEFRMKQLAEREEAVAESNARVAAMFVVGPMGRLRGANQESKT